MDEQIQASGGQNGSSLPAVREPAFRVVRRGYDSSEVDSYVSSLRRRIDDLEEMTSKDTAVNRALTAVGEEVAGILQQAHQTASDVLDGAQREGEHRVALATQEAREVTHRAEQRVRELDQDTEEILAERERIINDARELARQLLELAQGASERFPAALESDAYIDEP
jgi:cell division septum initiation protein DivIVA